MLFPLQLTSTVRQRSVPFSTHFAAREFYDNCTFHPFRIRSKFERRRSFIGDQVEECKDLSSLYYLLPFQKGFLVNWDTQRQLWDYVFGNDALRVNPQNVGLVFTEPVFNFASIQDTLNEIFFEEYKFQSFFRAPAPSLSALKFINSKPDCCCCLVVDTGYSFTHIVPFYRGKQIPKGVLRIDVGGKLLTNHLKDIISYRQLHVLDETYVINQVKEDVCFTSLDFYGDMATAKKKGPENTIIREYVLPDFATRRRGCVREKLTKSKPASSESVQEEQCLRLANERFSVPENLFHPSDIGIHQMGIPEAILHSVSQTPPEMHPHLLSNIVLTGGNCLFPGFKERVTLEVRKLAPDEYDVDVFMAKDPLGYAWGGGGLVADPERRLPHMVPVSATEYKEHGHSICHKRFGEMQVWNAPD